MADKPILFAGPLVRAILEGRKTQTRRILKPQPDYRGGYGHMDDPEEWGWEDECGAHISVTEIAPNGFRVGDRLWVREAHYMTDDGESSYAVFAEDEDGVTAHLEGMQTTMSSHPRIDWSKHIRLRPSIHMPRWASRLTLIVEDVRVQRLQDITLGDICAEGLARSIYDFKPVQRGFDAWADLWNSINGAGAWDANPWVVAVTFRTIRANIDSEEVRNG